MRWVPSSPNLFIVAHADGTIIVWDKERDDGTFTPSDPDVLPPPGPDGIPVDDVIRDAGGEWNPLQSIFVSMPPWHPANLAAAALTGAGGKSEKEKTAKNPVSHWRVARRAIVGACHILVDKAPYLRACLQTSCFPRM